MSIREEKTLRIVLFEGAPAQPLTGARALDLMSQLLSKGYTVTRTRTVVEHDAGRPMLVLGDFPELLERAPEGEVHFQNIRGRSFPEVEALVETARETGAAAKQGAWKPWFPVIDYDRCTNCMQCLSFCLFGVYGVDGEKQIQVQNNDNCKTNCPACSRVCPEAAIMFPKYKAGPINGDLVSQADLQREKMKIDISALLGGDVYQVLRDRSEKAKSRFSKERDSDKALKERQKCLTKLAAMGDIPAEVLMSLPSPEEIQKRAGEAAARAQAALGL
jgi:Pyruvate/2-oxoacid:ferredoxin oxidoreductase delta subunit